MRTALRWQQRRSWEVFLCAVAMSLLASGASCSKSEMDDKSGGVAEAPEEQEAETAAVQEQAAVQDEVPQAEEPEPSAEEVPVVEDFEEEAESSIDQKNYLAELERLEKEVGKDTVE